jgi:hypothetical protein
MPTASDQQRDLMVKWFGDMDIIGPLNFLFARGWRERGGMLIKPTPAHSLSIYESECVSFLCHEWDFGFDPRMT